MNSPESKAPVPRYSRRVSSAPLPLRDLRSLNDRSGSPVETLFSQPDVKIVQFATSGQAVLENLDAAREEAGSWPPWSRTERTIAMGTLSIYRAPGSVAFLNCGSALQPILPKSQCWCIDESNNTFVLQIRRPNYWRIELCKSHEEPHNLLGLRGVLDDILQFEKTYCPFQRSFKVDIPEESLTSVKKKAWSPKQQDPRISIVRGSVGTLASAWSETVHLNNGRPRTAQGLIESDAFAENTLHEKPSGCSSLDASQALPVASRQGASEEKQDVSWQQARSSTELDASQSSRNKNERDDSPRQIPFFKGTNIPQFHSTVTTVRPSTIVSPLTSPVHNETPSRSVQLSSQPDQLRPEDEMLVEHSHIHPEMRSASGTASDVMVTADSQLYIAKGAGLGLNIDSRVHTSGGSASPSPSEDSFHSVSSRKSSLSGITHQGRACPLNGTDAIRLADISDSSDTQPPLGESGSHLHQRYLANTGFLKDSPLSLVTKTSELLLRPPAYLIALMVRIAAKIRGTGRTGLGITYQHSDDDALVFYDFSESDLDD